MAPDVQNEGRALAGSKAEAVAALSWEELDAYDPTVEEVVGPSGERYRLSTTVFWDMEEWASGMYVIVKAAPTRGGDATGRSRPWRFAVGRTTSSRVTRQASFGSSAPPREPTTQAWAAGTHFREWYEAWP
jgi:hypothetical protein